MYRIMLIFSMFLFILPVFAERTVVTRQPYYQPYYNDQSAYYGGDYIPAPSRYKKRHFSRYSDISDLERYALNRCYNNDNDLSRIARLEMQAFGAVQSGDIDTRYENVRNSILSRPKQNYKTSLLRNLGNFFGGQMTGFTPSIYPSSFNSFPTTYGNSSVSGYSSPWGSGLRTNDYGVSSSSGVRILD